MCSFSCVLVTFARVDPMANDSHLVLASNQVSLSVIVLKQEPECHKIYYWLKLLHPISNLVVIYN